MAGQKQTKLVTPFGKNKGPFNGEGVIIRCSNGFMPNNKTKKIIKYYKSILTN